jgi:hypothetical protein
MDEKPTFFEKTSALLDLVIVTLIAVTSLVLMVTIGTAVYVVEKTIKYIVDVLSKKDGEQ